MKGLNAAERNKIRLWSEIILGIITAAVALLFIIEVADIYYSADGVIYSREIVGARLKILIAPMVIWIAGIITCYVLSVVFPADKKSVKLSRYAKVQKLKKRLPKIDGACPEMGRKIIYGISSAFAAAAAIIAIVYLADVSHFRSGQINGDILMLVKNVFPWIVASFILFIAAVIYDWATAKRELAAIGKMLAFYKGKPAYVNPFATRLETAKSIAEKNSQTIILTARIAVFVLALVFIGLGIANGGAGDVLYKAVAICTECIGLG